MNPKLIMIALLSLSTGWSGTAAVAQTPSPINSAKIMYVGHSLINDDLPMMVQAMAVDRGLTARSTVQWIVGSPLQYNWSDCRKATADRHGPTDVFACDELDRGTDIGPYDVFIATQANNPIMDFDNPWDLGTTPEDYEKFLNLFLANNPDGRAFFYTTWEGLDSPWHQGRDWTTRIPDELRKQEMWAEKAAEIYQQKRGRSTAVTIIPANLALQKMILAAEAGQVPGIGMRQQLFHDDVHLSEIGYYYIACVVYASVFQQSPAGATGYIKGSWGQDIATFEPSFARELQEFAWNVVAEYRGWSSTGTLARRPKAPTSLTVQ